MTTDYADLLSDAVDELSPTISMMEAALDRLHAAGFAHEDDRDALHDMLVTMRAMCTRLNLAAGNALRARDAA